MSRIRCTVLAGALTLAASVIPAAAASAVLEDFSSDPTQPRAGAPLFEVRGPGAAQFVHHPNAPVSFPGDRRGSLAVTYDSLAPTSRFFTTFAGGFTQDDDFVFGAVLRIRPEGFAADPQGFHPISFSLFNASTTGDERTGNLSDFRADTYDTVEFAYFPNISPLFGGPFLSPDAFGEQVSADAFANFVFGTVAFELAPGVTYLIEMTHDSATRRLTARVSSVGKDGRAVPVEGGTAVVDLSLLSGFLVNSLGISAYHDGFNIFSTSGRSLLATVDYEMLYSGLATDGRLPKSLERVLRRFRHGLAHTKGPGLIVVP